MAGSGPVSDSHNRFVDDPNIEVYLMDPADGGIRTNKYMHIDALYVRNHAAFASFACSKKLANMNREWGFSAHWDTRMCHVGFYATRNIEPGEELSYLRLDEEPSKRSSRFERVCGCKRPECSGRI